MARKYVDFEKLQERLSVEFSAIVFPPLPPRRLYCSEDDLEDRLVRWFSVIVWMYWKHFVMQLCGKISSLMFASLVAALMKDRGFVLAYPL